VYVYELVDDQVKVRTTQPQLDGLPPEADGCAGMVLRASLPSVVPFPPAAAAAAAAAELRVLFGGCHSIAVACTVGVLQVDKLEFTKRPSGGCGGGALQL